MVTTLGVKTCKRGHEQTLDNQYPRKRGAKVYYECRECRTYMYETKRYWGETVDAKREMPTIAVQIENPEKLTKCPHCSAPFPLNLIPNDPVDPYGCVQCGWRPRAKIKPLGGK